MLGSLFDASVWAALVAAIVAAAASVLFLRTRNFFYDSLALAVTEIGVIVLAAGIVAGAGASRMAGGLWWTWDARLTTGLVCWLIYVSYLMLRSAIEEPSRRASAAAIVSIFAVLDLPAAVLVVHWWLAHRATVRSAILPAEWWEILPLLMLAAALSWIRLTREQRRRAEDAARRSEQTI